MNKPIGVFDSGVGGLTVVQEIRRLMPTESIIYVGDTARAPYGCKDAETLISHGREIIRFMLKKKVKAVVMACGTSSSTSYEQLCKEFPDLPIVDTIRPAAKAVIAAKPKECAFAATVATVKSGLFERLVKAGSQSNGSSEIKIHSRACPLFAPMVEAGLATKKNNPLLFFAAENYFADLRGKVDTLILGCTHYPLLTDALTHALGEIEFINPATATAKKINEIFPISSSEEKAKIKYFTSGDEKNFSKIAKFILKGECNPKKIIW
ncbi:MAG: glutamate racemase [Clostridiales bacterium]|jgi:glutamate racemase|nr:glutamate racemase [Clostridiales bacterium]